MTDNKRNETKEAIVIGLRIGLVLLIPLFIVMAKISADRVTPPVATVAPKVSFTPEQIAEQKKREDEARKERQDAAIATDINNLKANDLLLAGAEKDLKNGNISGAMDMYFIGAVLEVIYSTAQSLQTCWNSQEDLSPENIKYLKSVEARLSSLQQKAFPKMRLAYKNIAKETLWEHDVNVLLSGSGNTILTMYSFIFAANANIKAAEEQISDLVTKLRFKKILYATDESISRGTGYKLDTPGDSTIAAYNNQFEKLDKNGK